MSKQRIAFWPPGQSTYGGEVDLLFVGLLALSLAVITLLFVLLFTFAIRYRASNDVDRSGHEQKSWYWEAGWTGATLVAFLVLFVWGAALYLQLNSTPDNALPIYIVAKQWMWKVQHPGGQREINELHMPVGQPIRLIMASQDVIHSFFIPAFRIKRDVLPGRYESLWLRAERTGEFPLLCAEFCGTEHSRMKGRIVVLDPAAYAAWLAQQGSGDTLASEGAELFRQLGCSGCHTGATTVRSPSLVGLYGKPVPLRDGTVTVADDRYLRDSILKPRSHVVAGYEAVMPTYSGRVSETDLVRLVAYIKSLTSR
jgi:cytochrome c oxidase subunit II